MANNTTVYLFGDQTDDARSYLRALLRVDHDPILESFLKRSFTRIRSELLRPYRIEDKVDSRFASLLELVDVELEGTQSVSLDHALTSICQFGLFLKHCHELGGRYPAGSGACLIGLCTGSLTAAAVSCCRTVSELLPVAVEVTVLSFRAGELATETGACHSFNSLVSNRSWAVAIPRVDGESVIGKINAFVNSKGLPTASQPFIGVRSPRGVPICGPPPTVFMHATEYIPITELETGEVAMFDQLRRAKNGWDFFPHQNFMVAVWEIPTHHFGLFKKGIVH